jgi:hypothetical protein
MSLPSPFTVQTPLLSLALPASVTAPTSVDVQLDDCADACDATRIAKADAKVFVVIAAPFKRDCENGRAGARAIAVPRLSAQSVVLEN